MSSRLAAVWFYSDHWRTAIRSGHVTDRPGNNVPASGVPLSSLPLPLILLPDMHLRRLLFTPGRWALLLVNRGHDRYRLPTHRHTHPAPSAGRWEGRTGGEIRPRAVCRPTLVCFSDNRFAVAAASMEAHKQDEVTRLVDRLPVRRRSSDFWLQI